MASYQYENTREPLNLRELERIVHTRHIYVASPAFQIILYIKTLHILCNISYFYLRIIYIYNYCNIGELEYFTLKNITFYRLIYFLY